MKPVSFIAWRFYLILAFILLAVMGLIGRVYDLTILDQRFLRHQGDQRVKRLINTPGIRGMLLDRNAFPLAVSTKVYSIWVNPLEFSSLPKQQAMLSRYLGIKEKELTQLLKRARASDREFVYLKRGLSPEVVNQVRQLHLPGLYTQEGYRRYYPEGEVMAHVIGFTNIDDRGQEGLELAYDQWLQGEPGKRWVIKDRLGRIISDTAVLQNQKKGQDLVLSIDRRLQYLVYRELSAGVKESEADAASAIVLDTKTGEVLAMVNYPSFNPNNRLSQHSDLFRNRAITDTFEPGSTLKAFSVACAIDSGRYQPNTVINTAPGWIRVGHNIVKDVHPAEAMTVTEVLQKSSNVGVTKMVLTLPSNQLWELLHRVGFGEATGIGFPGEQNGSLVKHNPWGAFTLATLAFGYGVSVTPLQLARAYAVLANEGIKLPVTILKREEPVKGERVMSTKTAKTILTLLESVVSNGSGKLAHVPKYRVAGKTGTTVKVGAHGYEKHRYISSFVGVAPVSHPRLVVAVVVHDPRGKQYYGGLVSGPIFERIMEGSLRILDVPPDAVRGV